MTKLKSNLTFDIKSTVRHYDDNGYLHVDKSNITKTQIVPYYGWEIPGYEDLGLTPDKVYQMYRPAEELKKAAPTFSGVPLAFEHHDMNAENMPKDKIVGTVGTEVVYKDPYVVAPLVITDADAIDKVNSGEYKELSAAYFYTPDMKPGLHNGEHYDGIMRDIRGNHVALVKEGRAGNDVVVADHKTVNKTHKGVLNSMKRHISTIIRRALAMDAVPEIEAAEVSAASLLSAINAIEAQREGLDPHTIGLDIDKAASVDDIIAKLFPEGSEEDKTAVKAILEKLKGAGAQDEEEVAEAEEAEAIDEDVVAGMEEVGLDADDPDAVKAFSEGVKFGEKKAAPEATDEDEVKAEVEEETTDEDVVEEETEAEDEDEVDEETTTDEGDEEVKKEVKAMDAKLRKMGGKMARFKQEIKDHYRGIMKAAQDCAPFAAIKDPMAFDSASDIYKKTLELNGVSTRGIDKSAFPAMVKMLRGQQATNTMAQDSKSYGKLPEALKGLNRIFNK